MPPIPRQTLVLVIVLLVSLEGLAQPPPGAPRPKIDLNKMTAAQNALSSFGCTFALEADRKDPEFGLVRSVKFPPKTTDKDLKKYTPKIADLPANRAIDLEGTKVTDKGMDEIAKLPDLGAIYLDNTEISNHGLEALSGLNKLYWIDISHSKITGSGFVTLKKFPALQHVTLQLDKANLDAIAPLAELVRLRELDIFGDPASRTQTEADCLKLVVGFEKLTKLTIHFSVGDQQAQMLSGLQKLESLELVSPKNITNAGLQAIVQCKKLKTLSVNGPKITAAQVDGFDDMAELNRLDLHGCRITDEGLKGVAKLPALEELHISNSAVTSKGLAALAGSETLKFLDINETQIDDAGLKALESVKTMRWIWAAGSKIRQGAATRFMTAVPGSTVFLKYEAGGLSGIRSPGAPARDSSLPKTSTGIPKKP